MRDKVKRFISILMTALMLVNLLPVGALAEGMKLDSNSVQSRASKKSANVYVYVKVTGDKAGLTINQSGWYTIGKSENVPGMGTPYWSMHGSHSFSDVGVSYKTVLKTNFTRWTDNQKIDLDQITWTEFYVDNGADDYVKAGTYTWHMNGTIDIKQLPSVYTIKYVDYDTKELIHSYEESGLMGQTPKKITAPDSWQENLYSFYFVNGHPKEQTVDFKKDKGELTFYYKKNTAAYTVNYYLNGTKTKVAAPKKGTAVLGSSVTESPITIEGYTPVSNDSRTINIKADSSDNVINFYYYKNVELTANSDEKTYNGNEHSVSGFTGAPEGSDFSAIKVGASGTDVGTYTAAFAEGTVGTVDTTEKYIVTKAINGTLKITPVTDKVVVTITGHNDTVTYNGSEQSVEGYEVSISAPEGVNYTAADFSFSGTAKAAGTNVGTYPMGLNADQFANTNGNFENVTFNVTDGWLKIDPVETEVTVTITGHTGSHTYDGNEKTVTGYDVSIDNELYTENDFTFTGTAEAKGTNAGTYPMGLTADQFVNTNGNFTNVTFNVTDGWLKIDSRPVTLTSGSAERVYNGKPLTNETVEVGGDGFAKDEGVTCDFTGSQTDVGSSKNTFTFEVNANTKKENYTFEVAIGTLKVNPVTDKVKVTITEKSGTVTYDGGDHIVSGYASMTADNPLYDVDASVQETPTAAWTVKGKDAGEYPVGIAADDFKNINTNFENVKFVVVDGKLTITPAPVTLQAPIQSKTYDGTPLKAEDYGHSFVEGVDFADDFASISVEGSQTQAGSSVSQIKEVVPKKGKDLKNYKLTFLPGSLTVAKRSVLLTSQSATKTYDGSALTRPAVTITGDGFVPGELAKVEATGSITNVGSTPNAIQYTTTGAFTPANYSIALSVGTLTVTAKPEPEPRRTFNLTVNYVYQNGKRAAASYNRGGLKNGETFDITSPVIAGYTASETVVSGTIDNRDIKVTVIYTADGVNLDDYGVPLGLGNITMNVGDCFE